MNYLKLKFVKYKLEASIAFSNITILICHLIIAYISGLEISAEFAYYTSISSIIAVLLGMQIDVKLISDNISNEINISIFGIIIIILLSALVNLILLIAFGVELNYVVILMASVGITFNELLAMFFIKSKIFMLYIIYLFCFFIIGCFCSNSILFL